MIDRCIQQCHADPSPSVLAADREARDPPGGTVVVEDSLECAVAADSSQGVTRHDSGPPGRLIIDVGQESDRDAGCIDFTLQGVAVA